MSVSQICDTLKYHLFECIITLIPKFIKLSCYSRHQFEHWWKRRKNSIWTKRNNNQPSSVLLLLLVLTEAAQDDELTRAEEVPHNDAFATSRLSEPDKSFTVFRSEWTWRSAHSSVSYYLTLHHIVNIYSIFDGINCASSASSSAIISSSSSLPFGCCNCSPSTACEHLYRTDWHQKRSGVSR